MDAKKRNHAVFQIFSYLVLIVCIIGTIQYVRLNNYKTLHSDESSELLLGNLLASENHILTKNWYYSTELEVFNTNIFFSFFFHFTDNWHQVRTLATISMYLLFLITLFFMSRVFDFRLFFALSVSVLFMPFSDTYYHIILRGAYYFPLLTISFLILIMAELFLKIENNVRRKLLLLLAFILSVLAGLGGQRQIFFTYLPLFFSSGIMMLGKEHQEKEKQWFIFSSVTFLGSVIGYLINSLVLSRLYSFAAWSDINFSYFSFSRLSEIINGFLSVFGFTTKSIYSDGLIRNAACGSWIFFTILSIYYAFRNRKKIGSGYFRLVLFTVCSYGIYIVFYLFTDMLHHNWYNIPIVCLSIPLAALFFEQVEWKKKVSGTILLILVGITAISGINYYIANKDIDPNEEVKQIVKMLINEEYFNGYSTFWYGNNLTELSNGKLDVWVLDDGAVDTAMLRVTDIDETYHWLQKVSHDSTHPSGKVFLFFTEKGFEINNWKDNLKEEDIIYQSDNYVIMGYKNYDHMVDTLYPGFDFDFSENYWMENGNDIDGHRELYYAGVSHGPYKTFWPGKYDVIVKGSNLSDSALYCISGHGEQIYDLTLIERNDESLHYVFELPEKAYNVETVIRNMSDEPESVVVLDTVSIKKQKY